MKTWAEAHKDKALISQARRDLRARISMLTCIAGTTGRPQINLPLAEVAGLPVGLALLGARCADEVLLACARDMAAALGQ